MKDYQIKTYTTYGRMAMKMFNKTLQNLDSKQGAEFINKLHD